MRKVLAVVILLTSLVGRAEEGMWIPSLLKALNESEMKTMGMKLSAEDLYSINKSSIKDAIVHFNNGCTAEVISKNGLILTNHHCGYGAINSHSTQEHNYLEDGFWAKTLKDELANPGMVCTFIIKIEDVTSDLLDPIRGLTDPKERSEAFKKAYQEVVDKESKGTHYKAVIKPFNYGNSYFVIVTETFEDIRLVGTPPDDVGKFGGDTDNWVWPRHTGDFSMFRIYAGADNKPAKFNESNVPFKPRHALPVSMEHRKEGEFTMVYGFPGSTDQYLISDHVDFLVNKERPRRVALRQGALDVINAAIIVDQNKPKSERKGTFLKYASKQARIANGWKKWIGQIDGLTAYNAVQKKETLEKEYLKLAHQSDDNVYREVVPELQQLYKEYHPIMFEQSNFVELYFISGPEILRNTRKYLGLVDDTLSIDQIKELKVAPIVDKVDGFFNNFDEDIDKAIFKNLFKIYLGDKELSKSFIPSATLRLMHSDIDGFVDDLYEKSIFSNPAELKKMLNGFSKKWVKKLKKDKLFQLVLSMDNYYIDELAPKASKYRPQENQLMRIFVEGMMKLMPDKRYWYDANSTLRVTYGKVEGSSPRDGMEYKYYTTMDGVLAKYDPENQDFQLPKKLVELARKRDYGPYAQDGELFVCFTGSNHTTGGNSGSPCINGEGHLIGLNFDRSWESTMSDIMFDPNICRNIMVDIRYVLFIIDKFAGAGHLLNEMELVTKDWREEKRNEMLKTQIKLTSDNLLNDPKNTDLLYQRAAYYDSLSLSKEAQIDVEAALKIDPTHAKSVLLKSKQLLANGEKAAALKVIETALKKKPQAILYFERGLLLTSMKQYLKAVSDFSKVIKIEPTNYKAFYDRGVAQHLIGRYENACADFKMAQQLGGNQEYFIYESACK